MRNISKIEGWHDKDPSKDTLEKLLQTEIEQNTTQAAGSVTDALLWLKRHLWMMEKFMKSMLNGKLFNILTQRNPSLCFLSLMAWHVTVILSKAFLSLIIA